MDQRMLQESDVNAVLKAYESSGEAVEDPEKWLAGGLPAAGKCDLLGEILRIQRAATGYTAPTATG